LSWVHADDAEKKLIFADTISSFNTQYPIPNTQHPKSEIRNPQSEIRNHPRGAETLQVRKKKREATPPSSLVWVLVLFIHNKLDAAREFTLVGSETQDDKIDALLQLCSIEFHCIAAC